MSINHHCLKKREKNRPKKVKPGIEGSGKNKKIKHMLWLSSTPKMI